MDIPVQSLSPSREAAGRARPDRNLSTFSTAWTWLWGGYSDTRCILSYENLPEGAAYHEEVGLWPPGGKCVYEFPSGEVTTRSGPVPWFEWFSLALVGLGVAAFAWLAALWGRRQGLRGQ